MLVQGNTFIACLPGGVKSYRMINIQRILWAYGRFEINGLTEDMCLPFQNKHGSFVIDCMESTFKSKEEIKVLLKAQFKQIQEPTLLQGIFQDNSIYLLIQSNTQPPNAVQTTSSWPPSIHHIVENIESKSRIFILGTKNTGKSMLCKYFINRNIKQTPVCLLDSDLGRGFNLPASVGLYVYEGQSSKPKFSQVYWIGQYTPLNYTKLFLQSVSRLVQLHKDKYFTYPLIVNTMGYLTGLGELILYEILNIVQPDIVVALTTDSTTSNNTKAVMNQIQSGSYQQRLHLLGKQYITGGLKKFYIVQNQHSISKHNASESRSKVFEERIGVKSIQQLLTKPAKQIPQPDLAIQSRLGKIQRVPYDSRLTDLQLLVLCKLDNGLLKFEGIAYGLNGKIYSRQKNLNLQKLICLKSQLVEFDKQFYNISEKELIAVQELLGTETSYMLPTYFALGKTGYRNIQSKSERGNKNRRS